MACGTAPAFAAFATSVISEKMVLVSEATTARLFAFTAAATEFIAASSSRTACGDGGTAGRRSQPMPSSVAD